MKINTILATSALSIALVAGAPAFAQVTESGPGSADNNTSVGDVVDTLDLLSNNGNGSDNSSNDQDNDANGDNRDNATDVLDLLSNNGNGSDNSSNDQDNDNNGDNRGNATDVLDLLSNNGNGSDNSSNDQDNDDNGDNRGNAVDVLDLLSNNGNGDNRDNATGNFDSIVGSNIITATQTLLAVNNNEAMDELVDLDGEDGSETPVGYNSGAAYARGNAFSAYAGISNNAWNTGINSNAQAATNIAAQGTVTFGSGAAGGGAGGGDDGAD